jgi:hypothetical protein
MALCRPRLWPCRAAGGATGCERQRQRELVRGLNAPEELVEKQRVARRERMQALYDRGRRQ